MSAAKPLAGLKVVELGTLIAGPFAARICAEFGADVIKVEPPEGDVMRHAGMARTPRMGAMYLANGRNKRSIVLDIKPLGAIHVVWTTQGDSLFGPGHKEWCDERSLDLLTTA
mgnify:CR=1 FL=1